MTATPWEVRQSIAGRVSTMTVLSGYQITSSDAWRESIEPMVETEPGPRAQLAFFVDDANVQQTDLHRGNAAEGAHIAAPVDIVFLYPLRPRSAMEDWDRSAQAAAHVLRTLIDWDPKGDDPAEAPFTIQPGPSALVREPLSADWVRVRVPLTVIYQLSLST